MFSCLDASSNHATSFPSISLPWAPNRCAKSYWFQLRCIFVSGISAGFIRAFCQGPFIWLRRKVTSVVRFVTRQHLCNGWYACPVSKVNIISLLEMMTNTLLLKAEGMSTLFSTCVCSVWCGWFTCLKQDQENNNSLDPLYLDGYIQITVQTNICWWQMMMCFFCCSCIYSHWLQPLDSTLD